MKKIVCLALAVLLCLGMAMSCMAESEEHTHSWKDGKPATCISEGSKICTVCGETTSIPKTSHSWKDGKPATCISEGSKICTVCGATESIPKTSHSWKDGKPASCAGEGSKICTVCGATESIPAKNHTWKDGKPATCSSEGNRMCTVCGETEKIAKLPHTEVVIAGKDATCTETGLTEGKKCTVCGTVTVEQKVIPAKGHTEAVVPGKAATCTEDGLTDGKKCSVCGTVTVEQKVIPATGHTEKVVPGKAATCTEDGLTDGKVCEVCGVVLVEQKVIPKTGHNFVSKKVPATTTSKGYTKHTCTVCGYSYKSNYTDMLPTPVVDPTVAPTEAPAVDVPADNGAFGSIVSDVDLSSKAYNHVLETKAVDGQAAAQDNVLVIVAEPDADGNYSLRNLHLSLDLLAQLKESGIEYIRFVVGDAELDFALSMFEGEDISLIAADMGDAMTGYVVTLDNNAANEAGCEAKVVMTTVDASEVEITTVLSGMTLLKNGVEI